MADDMVLSEAAEKIEDVGELGREPGRLKAREKVEEFDFWVVRGGGWSGDGARKVD